MRVTVAGRVVLTVGLGVASSGEQAPARLGDRLTMPRVFADGMVLQRDQPIGSGMEQSGCDRDCPNRP
jgi:hypothetical protein